MKQIIKQIIFVFVIFSVLSVFKIDLSCEIADVFYTVVGILFSIEISQTLSFDFSKIINDQKYTQFTTALKSVRNSLLWNFMLSTMAYAILKILDKNKIDSTVSVFKNNFDLKNFLCLFVIFSLVFLGINFKSLFEKKELIDSAVRQEEKENSGQ